MKAKASPTLAILLVIAISCSAVAQSASGLAGTVKDDAGHPVANVTVAWKNVASGQSGQTQSAADGSYSVPGLAAGEYEVAATAQGFNTMTQRVTVAAGAAQTLDLALTQSLSVESLGFPTSQTKSNPQEQARLDKRSHMLKMHQRLGLITTVPLAATLITGSMAGGKATRSTDRNVHAALGATTAGLYFTAASFAIFAPKVHDTPTRGPIRLHKALAWIHGPGMVLTPILGAMAYQQKSNGERVHGIASAHGAVAVVTAGAYGAAILSVSLRLHRKKGQSD